MPFSLSSSALNDYQRFLSLLVGNDAYVDTPALTVDYLVIAGGGGAGGFAGGGGAGGYRTSVGTSGGGAAAETALTLEAGTSYTVTVGAGGTGSNTTDGGITTNGEDSVFATVTSAGGGHSEFNTNGALGGSGGGTNLVGRTGGSGTTDQGFAGGNAGDNGGSGGGGAGGAGANSTNGNGVAGGIGVSSSITGSSIARGGGGGGGADYLDGGNTGGVGVAGGGTGSNASSAASSGTANTGGGGGGGGRQNGGGILAGGNGGSGLVVAKYPIAYDMTVSAGLGYKTVMYGEYKITEFTAGTGTVSFALAPTVTGFSEDILQEIVLEDSAASVTFADLDQYASTYQHLQIRYTARSADGGASGTDTMVAYLNGDTGANYRGHGLYGTGSSVGSQVQRTNDLYIGLAAGSSSTANAFAAGVVDILDPFETTKNTTSRSLSGNPTNFLQLMSGAWFNTNALTSIEIFIAPRNIGAGSRFTLIGVK